MATIYKKILKSITVTTVGGQTVTGADTVDEPVASNALAEFEEFGTMHIDGTLVPFHAVDTIAVTTSQSEDITRTDPFCEE